MNLVSPGGTRVKVPEHMVPDLKKRGYTVAGAVTAPAVVPQEVPVSAPESAPKPRSRTRKVTTPKTD